MTSCIYGSDTFEEGAVICVSGRGLRCVSGEWQETGLPCGEGGTGEAGSVKGIAPLDPPNHPPADPSDGLATKATR